MEGLSSNRLRGWILAWFYTTSLVCLWDASFIVFRPRTLPGGSLFLFWYPYKWYIPVDKRYGDLNDAFVFAVSLLNYVEVFLNVITIIMHYRNSRHTKRLAFTVTVMTFWKTVLYFLMFAEFCGDGHYREGNTALQEFFLVVIPNGIWVLVPFLVILKLWDVSDFSEKKFY